MSETVATAEIAQQAFRYMEMSELAAFVDGSPEATAAKQQHPVALETCLRRADWSFASTLAALPAALAEVIDPDLPYAYQLPESFLVLRRVGDGCARWRVDGRLLRCDQAAPLAVRYTARILREIELPADFRDLVALTLAVMLSPRFASSANRKEALEAARERAFDVALRSDRGMASSSRYDGRDEDVDWAHEAMR